MLREIVLSDGNETPLKGLYTVKEKETEVRDLIAVMLDMLGPVVVLNPMRTKQIGERLSRTERRTIVKETLPIRCSLLADEVATEGIATVIWIDHIATGEKAPYLATIEIDEIGSGMMIGRSSIGEEVIPEEALMSCLTVMRNLVEAGDDGLTVILKVRGAEEILRFVVHLTTEFDRPSSREHMSQ